MEIFPANHVDVQYLDLCDRILREGNQKSDRTGTGTVSLFGHQMRFDLSKGFPILTTKKVFFKGIVHELLWMLKGDTNIKYLVDNNVHIWDEWADEKGDLGPVYGFQWRHFDADYHGIKNNFAWPSSRGTDQIKEVIEQLKTNPDSRRMIVTAWNPNQVKDQALPSCHAFFQFYVANGKLSCQMYQRSADVFLGVPFNIASYALLTHMMAQIVGLEVGELVHTFGDVHIYNNHIEQIKEQMTRLPKNLPTLKLNKLITNIDDFKASDIFLDGYEHHPTIKGKVSI